MMQQDLPLETESPDTDECERSELSWAPLETRAGTLDEEARTIDFVASTDAIDSYGEIVEQDWLLDRYRANPTILYGHNKAGGGGLLGGSLSPEQTLPIGRALSVKVVGNKKEGRRLMVKAQFATEEENPFAEKVWSLLKGGFLRAVSVGFMPHDAREEKRDGQDVFVLRQNELFEVSVVPIGANPGAVALTFGDRQAHRARLRELVQKKESEMELTEATARVTELEAELAKTTETIQAERENATRALAEVATLTDTVATLTAERDAERARADELEAGAIEAELRALVGKKFHAAELDDMREDRRRLGAKVFSERMARRANVTTTLEKTGPDLVPVKLDEPTPGSLLSEHAKRA